MKLMENCISQTSDQLRHILFAITICCLGSLEIQANPLGTAVVQLDGGHHHQCGFIAGGDSVKCWPVSTHPGFGVSWAYNEEAMDDYAAPASTHIVDFSAGPYVNCALLSTGSSECWGNGYTDPDLSEYNGGDAVTLVVGQSQTCVLTAGGNVKCEGDYKYHLQGVCTNERDAVFWSFTTDLVKTDRRGRVQKKVAVANHHGDLCFSDGKPYITVNLDRFNNPNSNADSWVCVYKADTLKLLA